MKDQLIEEVRRSIAGRDSVIKSLYTDNAVRNGVIGTLVKLGCGENEAKDYFTDAIVSFVKACYRPEFVVRSTITNYLIGTAKNIWLKEVTKSTRERTTMASYETENISPIEDYLISEERSFLLRKLINQLDDTCQKVLTLWAQNNAMKEIARQLAYVSEGMARKKKHQCMRKLYVIVDSNSQIKKDLRSQ